MAADGRRGGNSYQTSGELAEELVGGGGVNPRGDSGHALSGGWSADVFSPSSR